MWYVIQTVTGTEEELKEQIESIAEKEVCRECLVPLCENVWRKEGIGHISIQRLFPGYLFVDTDQPKEIYRIQKEIQEQSQVVADISQTMTQQSTDADTILSSTNTVVKQIGEVSNLTKNQANYTEEIMHDLNEVVSLTGQVNDSVAQSESVIKSFSESFSTVKKKAEANKQSVLTITNEINKFKL